MHKEEQIRFTSFEYFALVSVLLLFWGEFYLLCHKFVFQIEIALEKSPKFDELMAASQEEKEREAGNVEQIWDPKISSFFLLSFIIPCLFFCRLHSRFSWKEVWELCPIYTHLDYPALIKCLFLFISGLFCIQLYPWTLSCKKKKKEFFFLKT